MKASAMRYRKLFTVAILVIATSTLASVYFFQVVPQRVDELNNRGFRILARMEKNTTEKKNNVIKTIDQVYSNWCKDTIGLRNALFEGLSLAHVNKTGSYTRDVLPSYVASDGKWYLNFYGRGGDEATGPDECRKVMKFQYDIEAFFANLLNYRDDFFQDFIVLQGDRVLYQTRPLIFKNRNPYDVDAIMKKRFERNILFTDFVAIDTLSGTKYYTFYHPFNSASDLKYTICGLVTVNRYTHEKYSLRIIEIVWASIILMLFVAALPFVKVFTVSKFEPILYTDAVLSGIALLGGTAVVTLILILAFYDAAEETKQDRAITVLSDTLQKRIDHEIEQSLLENIQQEDSLIMKKNPWLTKAEKSSDENDLFITPQLNQPNSHHFIESILLIDGDGHNWGTWRHKSVSHRTKMDLSTREYVRAFTKHNPKAFTILGSPTNKSLLKASPFYMQTVYSWQNQENTVIYSRETHAPAPFVDKLKVFATETRLFSVMKTALPQELEFLIVNQQGDVLFHSEDKRNLRENFIEEVDKSSLVSQIIKNHLDTTLAVYYYGRNHQTYFRPLTYAGLTLVTLCDDLPKLTSVSNEVTFTVAMLLILVIFGLSLMFSTYLLSRRPAILKRTRVNLTWLRRSIANDYTFAVLSLLLLIPTIISLTRLKGDHLLYLPFIVVLLTLTICGATLLGCNRERYSTRLTKKFIFAQFRIFFVLLLTGTVLLYIFNIYAQPTLFQSFEGIITIFLALLLLILSLRPTILFSLAPKMKVIRAFAAHDNLLGLKEALPAITLILILFNFCAVPTFNFFTFAIRQETNFKLKRQALEIAKEVESRKSWLSTNYHDKVSTYHEMEQSMLFKGTYYPHQAKDWLVVNSTALDIKPVSNAPICKEGENKQSVSTDRIYAAIVNIVTISRNEYDAGYLYPRHKTSVGDVNLWRWDNEARQLETRIFKCCDVDKLSGLSITLPSPESTIKTLSGIQILCLALIILLCFAGCYRLIVIVRRRLVLSDYFHHDSMENELNADRDFIKESISTNKSNLIVISLPVKDAFSFIKDSLINAGYSKISQIEGLQSADIPHYQYQHGEHKERRILLLRFFSLKAGEVNQCEQKIDALSHFFRDKDTKVIWLTETDPCDQVGIIAKEYIDLYGKGSKDKDSSTELTALQSRIDKLLNLLDDFQRTIFALQKNNQPRIDNVIASGEPSSATSTTDRHTHYELEYVDDEFRYGIYFKDLRDAIIKSGMIRVYFQKVEGVWATKFRQAEETFVLKIQEMALSYYLALWTSLSKKEKYILYDLAKDELTNYNNFSILNDLRRKGILFVDGEDHTLKLFNKSFRNFILSVVDPQDALILEKEIKVQGTWDLISTGLIVLFAVVGVILFLTEQSIYNKILGLITAMTTLVPTLVKFLGPSRSSKGGG